MTAPQLLEREAQRAYVPWSPAAPVMLAPSTSSLGSRSLQSEFLGVGAVGPYVILVARSAQGRRHTETEWRRTHGQVLRAYSGEWVVLEGQRLVVHAATLEDAVRQARAAGVAVPYVFRVDDDGQDLARIGL